MNVEEVEWHQEHILITPVVIRDREYLFSKDIDVEGSGTVDVCFAVLVKVSSLVEALCLGGSYELVHQLWSQITLTSGQMNVDVTSSLDEISGSVPLVAQFLRNCPSIFIALLLLLLVSEQIVPPHLQ